MKVRRLIGNHNLKERELGFIANILMMSALITSCFWVLKNITQVWTNGVVKRRPYP